MEENVRTWVWFFSVMLAMTLGPALLGTLFICGAVQLYRHYRGFIAEKLSHLHMPQMAVARIPVKSRYSQPY
jgi:hypothetical protein